MLQRSLWLVSILVLGLAIWVFTLLFEEYEYEKPVGYTREALLNPFLAAKLFLESHGVTVVSQTDVLDFSKIGVDEKVFLSNVDDMILSHSQIDDALDWVHRGGFLVVGVGSEIKGHATILEDFDINPVEYSEDFSDIFGDREGIQKTSERLRKLNKRIEERQEKRLEDGESNQSITGNPLDVDNVLDSLRERQTYTLELIDELRTLELEVLDRIVLYHPSTYRGVDEAQAEVVDQFNESYEEAYVDNLNGSSIGYDLDAFVEDENGPRLLQFSYGDGEFTALSSSLLWENSEIGNADHAFFLSYLIPDGSIVHFFYNVNSPSIAQLLKRYFAELLLALVVLLILWLWRSGLRVEGIKEVVTSQRRQFSEHLLASAKFLVAQNQYQTLLAPINEDIESHMRLSHPGFSQLGDTQKTSLLAIRTEMPKETIHAWLEYLTKVESQDEMIAALKLGNAIRKKL